MKKIYFWPVPPNRTHTQFRIQKRESGKIQAVRDPRLVSVNTLFKSHTIDAQTARTQVDSIVKSLRDEIEPDKCTGYPDANIDIFERYFREEYESRDILPGSLEAARSSFKRALALLGDSPIPTVSPKQVQARIFALPYPKRWHVVLALNALFKHAGRTETRFETGTRRGTQTQVKYLSLIDLKAILPHISNPTVRLAAAAAFATGARVGELFALHRYNPQKRVLTIDSQTDRALNHRATKTYSTRSAVVVKELEEETLNWLKTPQKERLFVRNFHLGAYVQRASRKAFPEQTHKHCHFYDLRHSYAIHFLSLGVSLSLIAQALGNSEAVCRRHYTGHITSDEGTDLINRIQERSERS